MGGCNEGHTRCPLSLAPTPATRAPTPPTRTAAQLCSHSRHTRAITRTPAHACTHTHTHRTPADAPLTPNTLPTSLSNMGCCAPCPQWHILQSGMGQWGAEEAEVTPSAATGSPMLPSCTYRPTPPQEPGGCWEAQAPTQHHFLLSLCCRVRPGRGDVGGPEDIQVAQVGAACSREGHGRG